MLNRTLCWGQTPRFCRMVLKSERISLPMMYAVPDVGGISPVKMDLNAETHHVRSSTCYIFAFSHSQSGFQHLHGCGLACTIVAQKRGDLTLVEA